MLCRRQLSFLGIPGAERGAQRPGAEHPRRGEGPQPAPAYFKHMAGLTQDNWIIFLPAVKYILKLSMFGLGHGTQHLAGLCAPWEARAGALGGHSGTRQLSSHVPVHAEPV